MRAKEIRGEILRLEKQLETKEQIYEFLYRDFKSGKYLKSKKFTMQQLGHIHKNLVVLEYEIDRRKDIIVSLT